MKGGVYRMLTNELTQKIQRILTPKAALIAYRCDECRTNSTEYFLELRPIHEKTDRSGDPGCR